MYVAGFSKKYTRESDLRRAFEEYGRIERIDLKEGRGFGFIYFERKKDALYAIDDMNGRRIGDDRVVVEKAG